MQAETRTAAEGKEDGDGVQKLTPTLSFAMAGGCFRTSLTVCMTVSVRMALTERTSSTSSSCSSLAKGIT